MLDGVWSVLDCVGCWSVQTNPTPSNNVGFQYQAQNYGVFLITRTKMWDDVGWKVWTNSNFVHPTSSNTVQRYSTLSNMFDCAVQTGKTYCVHSAMFDVWPTCLYVVVDKVVLLYYILSWWKSTLKLQTFYYTSFLVQTAKPNALRNMCKKY